MSVGSRTYLFDYIESSMNMILNIARLILITHVVLALKCFLILSNNLAAKLTHKLFRYLQTTILVY